MQIRLTDENIRLTAKAIKLIRAKLSTAPSANRLVNDVYDMAVRQLCEKLETEKVIKP